MTGKLVAIVLAAVAVVLAGIALIVVATRPEPAAQATIETRTVAATAIVQLHDESEMQFDAQGAHVDDATLAARLGLLPGDTIVTLSGLPISRAYDVFRVITLNGKEIYAELARAGSTRLVRWKIDGELRAALDKFQPTRLPRPPADVPALPDPLLDTIVHVDDTHVRVPRTTIEAILADPTKYMTQMRVVPAITNGVPSGFKVYAIRPSSLPARLGLQNGDRIDAINGMKLDSAEAALEAYTKLRHAVQLDLSLTRRNQPVEITISIN